MPESERRARADVSDSEVGGRSAEPAVPVGGGRAQGPRGTAGAGDSRQILGCRIVKAILGVVGNSFWIHTIINT